LLAAAAALLHACPVFEAAQEPMITPRYIARELHTCSHACCCTCVCPMHR
jgi:hypothetical protein